MAAPGVLLAVCRAACSYVSLRLCGTSTNGGSIVYSKYDTSMAAVIMSIELFIL